jgi:hypothetical protein
MTHLFRPADPTPDAYSPSWKRWRGLLYVAGRLLVLRVAGLFHPQRRRAVAAYLLLVLGLVVQMVLLLVAAYLCDLALSLMELWAALARKHLEITLS